jgi:uncharacterized protein (UPF0254 family)
MAENTNNIIYTSETAAELLKCSERVLKEKLKVGIIKGYKKMNKWYTLHSHLIAYLESDKD